jgi:hypothetical protein
MADTATLSPKSRISVSKAEREQQRWQAEQRFGYRGGGSPMRSHWPRGTELPTRDSRFAGFPGVTFLAKAAG